MKLYFPITALVKKNTKFKLQKDFRELKIFDLEKGKFETVEFFPGILPVEKIIDMEWVTLIQNKS